jgi:hypothetical protein
MDQTEKEAPAIVFTPWNPGSYLYCWACPLEYSFYRREYYFKSIW